MLRLTKTKIQAMACLFCAVGALCWGPAGVAQLTVTDVSPDSAFGDPASGGTDPAGRIMVLAIDPTNDSILYAASENAGIWKSEDAGHTWHQWSAGLRTGMTQNDRSLAIDAGGKRLLYATQDDDGRPSQQFGGLWVWVLPAFEAASWQHIDLPSCASPNINSVIFASGLPFVTTRCGIFSSSDPSLADGSWQLLPTTPPFDVNGSRLYAGWGQTLFACPARSTKIYRSLSLGSSTSAQPNGWTGLELGPGNACFNLAPAPLGHEPQPSTVVVVHTSNSPGGYEVSVVNFDGVPLHNIQPLGFSPFAVSGSGVPEVFAVLRPGAPAGETRPGYAYDVYASDSCTWQTFNPTPAFIVSWSKLGGGGGGCNSGSSGIHGDTWSMAFPSTYDPGKGICTAYAATDGGVFVNNTSTPGVPCSRNSGWVQAQSGLHALSSGTMAGVSQALLGPALYLPTADNDVWATIDGGHSWQPFADGLGDAGQTFMDPALSDHEVSARNGGVACAPLTPAVVKLSVSKDGSPPTTTPNNLLTGPTCISEANMYSGLQQPPNQPAFSQVMALASETAGPEGYYIAVESPSREACPPPGPPNCKTDSDVIVQSAQQDNASFWRAVSLFGPAQVAAIATSGGVTNPIVYVLTASDINYDVFSKVHAGQVWRGALSNGTVSAWTLLSTGLNRAIGLFANPYKVDELYVTDMGNPGDTPSIKVFSSWIDPVGGVHQSWQTQAALTDIATNHGEFVINCKGLNSPRPIFNGTCSLSGIAFDRNNPGIRVAAMYPGGLAASRDGGVNWMELDVTNNAPHPCPPDLVFCPPTWDLIEYPQSVFYDSSTMSIYMALAGNSVKRVDGVFQTTLISFPVYFCMTCVDFSYYYFDDTTPVYAVFASPGLTIPVSSGSESSVTIPLIRGSDGLYRGNLLFDSAKVSEIAFHFVVNGKSTRKFSHTLSAAEISSGVSACSSPKLRVSLKPDELRPQNHKLVPIKAEIRTKSACGVRPAVQLVSITSNEHLQSQDVRGAHFGTDDRWFELAAKSGQATGRVYTVTYKATDLFGATTQATAQVVVRHGHGKHED